jgi:hypothetical protein
VTPAADAASNAARIVFMSEPRVAAMDNDNDPH